MINIVVHMGLQIIGREIIEIKKIIIDRYKSCLTNFNNKKNISYFRLIYFKASLV